MGKSRTEDYRCSQSKECTYRQLQQERVQLLIGQSTLQIQEQSTLGTMQQSSLQHYSVLGSLLGNYMESTDMTSGGYIGQYGAAHGWVRSSTELQQDLVQASTAWCRLPGSQHWEITSANQSLYANY